MPQLTHEVGDMHGDINADLVCQGRQSDWEAVGLGDAIELVRVDALLKERYF